MLRENFRVVAEVDERYTFSKDPSRREAIHKQSAEELLAQIKRHCDAASAHIECDTVCSHCGRGWEVEASGEPVCCDAAQKEWAAVACAPATAL